MSIELPAYADIEAALLQFLAKSGPIKPGRVYGPLADEFNLTREQRTVQRDDNATPLWNNRVQWARKSLKDKGYLSSELRMWVLSDSGMAAARRA